MGLYHYVLICRNAVKILGQAEEKIKEEFEGRHSQNDFKVNLALILFSTW